MRTERSHAGSPFRCRLEVIEDRFGLGAIDDGAEGGGVSAANGLHTAEVFQQPSHGGLADAGNLQQLVGAVAHLAALAVECDGEAMGFVADDLNDVQDGRMVVEDYRFVFLPVDVYDFFALGDGGQWLAGEL